MKVSGFTFIRNAQKFDYPIVEAINSILPLCDEVVVCVGNSDDDTLELIQHIQSDKIKIIRSVWNDSLRKGGQVLAVETNKALDAISPDADWAFYIQGDEVLHEQYIPAVRQTMEKYKDDKHVEGLLFKYEHFYGSYDYVGTSRRWYRHEIRVIRNNKTIRSYRDAQGFRRADRKLNVKPVDAYIYHYGWVKPPQFQYAKVKNFHSLYTDEQYVNKRVTKADEFDYSQIDGLRHFTGTHPAIMQPRIDRMNWKFDFDPTRKAMNFRYRLLHLIENLTGKRPFEYKNYKLV